MAIQKDGKWYPIIDNEEVVVFSFESHKMVKVGYSTKKEAEEKEKEIKEITNT